MLRYFQAQMHTRPVTTTIITIVLIELVLAFTIGVLYAETTIRAGVVEWTLAFVGGVLSSAFVGAWQSYRTSSRINQQFNIVKTTTACGILNIYANRKDAAPAIRTSFTGTKEVCVLSIAGQDFLSDRGEFHASLFPGNPTGAHANVRMMLLNPLSHFALERSNREAPTPQIVALDTTIKQHAGAEELMQAVDYEQRELFKQIRDSISSAQMVKNAYSSHHQPDLLRVRLYDAEPHFHIVIAGDDMFVEFYHLGRTPDLEGKILNVCIAGRVPVFHIDVNSSLGKQLCNHFEYLWERSKNSELAAGQNMAKAFLDGISDPALVTSFAQEWGHTLLAARTLPDPAQTVTPPIQARPSQQAAE